MRRALFFPWSAGGGAGYTCRCLALAQEIACEYECLFGAQAIPEIVAEAGFPLLEAQRQPTRRSGQAAPGVAGAPPRREHRRHDFLSFANVERVYATAARYYRVETVREHVLRDRAAIEAHEADVAVIDMQPTAAIAARSLGVPVVSIADADFLSPSPRAWMPWLTLAPDALLPYPSCTPALNQVLEQLGLAPVRSPTELLWGDVTLVPSCRELEPLPAPPPGRRAATHIGPLYWDPPGAAPELPSPAAGTARVYVTVGSGGMVTARILQRVLDALERPGLAVFASAGIEPPPGLSGSANSRRGGFTGLTQAIRWSDAVVTHGGYSTVIATISLGRPQAVIPLMSEHEANARQFVEQPGCGVLIRRTRTDAASGRVRFVDRDGAESGSPLPRPEEILDAVQTILMDGSWRDRARAMSRNLRHAREARDALSLFDIARGRTYDPRSCDASR
jgi:UDP:flavonoid glycosyltransferase YjiC (YdhE family)